MMCCLWTSNGIPGNCVAWMCCKKDLCGRSILDENVEQQQGDCIAHERWLCCCGLPYGTGLVCVVLFCKVISDQETVPTVVTSFVSRSLQFWTV